MGGGGEGHPEEGAELLLLFACLFVYNNVLYLVCIFIVDFTTTEERKEKQGEV